ncbi:nitroreductase family protein [Gorillibacterium sp. sgz500922]|uniref:nitroreductase family protein n=1 Tax=Gorillibacterium sp. sgz500922 TaxID=3446694 RepID=UPI003F66B236
MMAVSTAIRDRRSIRIFRKDPVSKQALEEIIDAGILAPSAHNRQPWRFVVLQEESKPAFEALLTDVMKTYAAMGKQTGTLKRSIGCIRRASAAILVFNPYGYEETESEPFTRLEYVSDIQSLGACIQNMLLAAHALGLGSLWIGDVLYGQQEIAAWANISGELIACICFGYPDEEPLARPRLERQEVAFFK